ncbi:MAG: arylmalonate decarboxylase [Deltaproteobacteria bacterium]|nr:arylmalonate decarboxylase [Deltaproteobacteria bacterium]
MARAEEVIPPVVLDRGPSPRARFGFVILAGDETSEPDLYGMAPPGVGFHFSRIESPGFITAETLSSLMPDMVRAASLILPARGVDAVCFHCTSGGVLMGEDNVRKQLARACPGAVPTTVVSAINHALEVLNIKAFSLLTPYTDDINDAFVSYFTGHGFQIPRIQGMQFKTDPEIAGVSPETIVEWAQYSDHDDAEALLISCTGLRASGLVSELEERLGKPVLTSNQAALWHMMRTAGLDDHLEGFGMLFEH